MHCSTVMYTRSGAQKALVRTFMNYRLIRLYIKKYPTRSICVGAFFLYAFTLLLLTPFHTYEGNHFTLYTEAATSLVGGNGFGDLTYIAPGWPLAIAPFLLFVSPVVAVGILNILSMVAIVSGVYRLGTLLFNRSVGYYGALLAGVWPIFLAQMFEFGSSILFYTALLVWGAYCVSKAYMTQKVRYAFVGGILLGFGSLVDVIGLYVPLIFASVMVFFFLYRKEKGIEKWKAFLLSGMVVVAALLVIIPWTYRNVVVFGSLSQAPVITKVIEQEIWWEKSLQQRIIMRIEEEGIPLVYENTVRMFLIPFNLSTFDHHTDVSYKEAILSGQIQTLTTEERGVLVFKVGTTLLYWITLLLGVYGFMRSRNNILKGLFLVTLGYIFIAVLVVGSTALVPFSNISPPASFFFPCMPLVFLFAIYGYQCFLEKRRTL